MASINIDPPVDAQLDSISTARHSPTPSALSNSNTVTATSAATPLPGTERAMPPSPASIRAKRAVPATDRVPGSATPSTFTVLG
ncbi:hypothetical protein DFH11DRAFT_1732725 [Phellopilus nigrolimitatus]|nr:hypothetical protein DFH11DRAFT_1732725 [Phellopilus nigrolimitatus]